MSLQDFFRRAFGLTSPYHRDPKEPGFRNPIWEEESDDDDDELDDEFRYSSQSPFGFRIFSGDIIDMHKYFEQQMDEMMTNFHSSFFGSDLLQLPDNRPEKPSTDSGNEIIANKYLKPWVENNVEEDLKQDTDIDGRLTSGDLTKFFPNEEDGGPSTSVVPTKVFGHSVITRIVRTSDGRMEEERRVHGSDGREEVSLTRQIGDQKYKVITKKDQQSGITDTTEELINLDQDKLDEFNKQWDKSKSSVNHNNSGKKILSFYPSADADYSANTPITRLFEKWFK